MNHRARLGLQVTVAVAGLVPVAGGLLGLWQPAHLDLTGPAPAFSHVAYLSGLLLGIGLGFWSTIPAIETKSARFALLTAIVVLGGLARLVMAIRLGTAAPSVILPLVMELGVTPALWLWQRRLAKTIHS